jgi:D-amino peptidase
MKIMIVTDLEGVAGVQNFEDWCSPGGCYYDKAKRLLTLETNAVIEGFFAGGATEIRVVDGHGPGAIDPELLDERVELQRGAASPVWPFTLDRTFDGIGWVGQHAMSRTPFSHISHTGTFSVFETTVNGIPVGEFGYFALAAAELGVPVIFAGGEEAFAREAENFSPGVVTVSVKRGCNSEEGLDDVTEEVYSRSKLSAIHLSPARARALLRAGAQTAMEKLMKDPASFHTTAVTPPYEIITRFRKSEKNPDSPAFLYRRHETSFIDALNAPYTQE